MHAIHSSFEPAIIALGNATQWLLDTFPRNPNAVLAVSVPYLDLWGTVLGGSIMARSALLAEQKLAVPDADTNFLDAKVASARFYAAHILPRALALAEQVQRGAESVLAVDAADF